MPTKPTGRPRGRPPGVKNKPKTAGDFVLDATANRPVPIPRPAKKAPRGPWANMNEEERKAYSQKLVVARKGPRNTNNTIPGRPRHLSNEQYAELKGRVHVAQQRPAGLLQHHRPRRAPPAAGRRPPTGPA